MIKILFLFFPLLAACSSGGSKQSLATRPAHSFARTIDHTAKVKAQLPAFAVLDINGAEVNLQSFAGKKVFLNLWATWCPPCRAEMPEIEKLYKAADKNKVAFLMVSLDDNFEKAKKYVKRKKLDLPIYYPLGALPELFQVQGIPTTFIFNEQGELLQQVEGAANYNTPEYRRFFGATK